MYFSLTEVAVTERAHECNAVLFTHFDFFFKIEEKVVKEFF